MNYAVRVIVAALSAMLIVSTGCGGDDDSASGELVAISDVQQFASDFNRDSGHPRLVLLLSPT